MALRDLAKKKDIHRIVLKVRTVLIVLIGITIVQGIVKIQARVIRLSSRKQEIVRSGITWMQNTNPGFIRKIKFKMKSCYGVDETMQEGNWLFSFRHLRVD